MTVLIGGYEPDSITVVETSKTKGSSLGSCSITMQATPNNRANISAGDDIEIDRYAGKPWTGYVTGIKPVDGSSDLFVVQGLETRLELKHGSLQQVFYNQLSSEAVKQSIEKQAQPLDKQLIHSASSTTDWSSNAPVFQLYDGTRAGLYDWGTNLVAVGARQGHTGTLTATYENVTSTPIQDGIYELETRLIADRIDSARWNTEIELVTPDGTTYVWSPDFDGTETLVLAAEEATTDGLLSETGVLQYRFSPQATLADNSAIAIDHAATLPFRLRDRPTTLSTAGVEATDRRITRRSDRTVGVFIDRQATEDQRDWGVEDDVVYYRDTGDDQDLAIVAGETQVVGGAIVEQDFESIRNVVTVVGDGVEVTERDKSSIEFYGPTSRPEPIVDRSLKTERECRDRAKGYLDDNAWTDTVATFPIANTDYAALTSDDRIKVDWPPRGLDGRYSIDEVDTQSAGIVSISIIASSRQ